MAVGAWGLRWPEDDWVRFVGKGLSRCAFSVGLEQAEPRGLVALVPREQSAVTQEAVEREARLLRFLEEREVGFLVPRFATVACEGGVPVLVCEALEGLSFDLRAGRMLSEPWELVAGVAAKLHGIATEELIWLPGHATRRAHGAAVIGELEHLGEAPDAEVMQALEWLEAHPPPAEASRLVHGDLLGQNILRLMSDELAVIDWERASLGDPAYDLAILTWSCKRPFQVADGKAKLLDAYARAGGEEVTELDVRFHEIGLNLLNYDRARKGEPSEPAAVSLSRLRRLVSAPMQ